MKCIFCKKGTTEVVNSRPSKGLMSVWRRRKCIKCKAIFTTDESLSYDRIYVIKRNLTRKKFVYEKLFSSILHSVMGGKNQDMGDCALLAKKITREVISEVLNIGSKYISTKEIIKTTYEKLAKINPFFASRYKMFSDYRLKIIQNS